MSLRRRRLKALGWVIPFLLVVSAAQIILGYFDTGWMYVFVHTVLRWPITIGYIWFITGRIFAEEKRLGISAQRLAQFETLTANMSEGFFLCDRDGHVTAVNPEARRLWGIPDTTDALTLDDIARTMIPRSVDGDPIPAGRLPVMRALQGETIRDFEHKRLNRETGREITALLSAAPFQGPDGQIEGAIVLLRDISEQKRLQQAVQMMATTDALTGLSNRHQMDNTLQRELALASRSKQSVGVLMVDVDHFKQVNDAHGHALGDEALVHLAGVLRSAVRETDEAFRYGGEEFLLVLPSTSSGDAKAVAERIQGSLRDRPAVLSSGEAIYLEVSVGIAIFPDSGFTADDLITNADHALYPAKMKGRNRWVEFLPL